MTDAAYLPPYLSAQKRSGVGGYLQIDSSERNDPDTFLLMRMDGKKIEIQLLSVQHGRDCYQYGIIATVDEIQTFLASESDERSISGVGTTIVVLKHPKKTSITLSASDGYATLRVRLRGQECQAFFAVLAEMLDFWEECKKDQIEVTKLVSEWEQILNDTEAEWTMLSNVGRNDPKLRTTNRDKSEVYQQYDRMKTIVNEMWGELHYGVKKHATKWTLMLHKDDPMVAWLASYTPLQLSVPPAAIEAVARGQYVYEDCQKALLALLPNRDEWGDEWDDERWCTESYAFDIPRGLHPTTELITHVMGFACRPILLRDITALAAKKTAA